MSRDPESETEPMELEEASGNDQNTQMETEGVTNTNVDDLNSQESAVIEPANEEAKRDCFSPTKSTATQTQERDLEEATSTTDESVRKVVDDMIAKVVSSQECKLQVPPKKRKTLEESVGAQIETNHQLESAQKEECVGGAEAKDTDTVDGRKTGNITSTNEVKSPQVVSTGEDDYFEIKDIHEKNSGSNSESGGDDDSVSSSDNKISKKAAETPMDAVDTDRQQQIVNRDEMRGGATSEGQESVKIKTKDQRKEKGEKDDFIMGGTIVLVREDGSQIVDHNFRADDSVSSSDNKISKKAAETLMDAVDSDRQQHIVNRDEMREGEATSGSQESVNNNTEEQRKENGEKDDFVIGGKIVLVRVDSNGQDSHLIDHNLRGVNERTPEARSGPSDSQACTPPGISQLKAVPVCRVQPITGTADKETQVSSEHGPQARKRLIYEPSQENQESSSGEEGSQNSAEKRDPYGAGELDGETNNQKSCETAPSPTATMTSASAPSTPIKNHPPPLMGYTYQTPRGRKRNSSKPDTPRKTKSQLSGINFPVARFIKKMKKGRYAKRIGVGAGIYMAAVLEYLVAEVLDLAGLFIKDVKRVRINPRAILLTLRKDSELDMLTKNIVVPQGGVVEKIHQELLPARWQQQLLQQQRHQQTYSNSSYKPSASPVY